PASGCRQPKRPPLPYTTLFRSIAGRAKTMPGDSHTLKTTDSQDDGLPFSFPLSAWRRGGQGVRTEGRGDQRGEDRMAERGTGGEDRKSTRRNPSHRTSTNAGIR